jgi:hypothetical protein
MWIIGCDFHPSWQQVAWFNSETGESGEAKLENGNGEAEPWYRQLPVPSLIGLEATGNAQWFVEMLQQLGHEVWIGDAAQIRASYVRKQKNDKRDAAYILKLLREGRFPRLWVPSGEQRDVRQLLIHRHKLVEIRTRVKNGLQHLAMNRGMQKKRKLWSEAGQKALRELPLEGWAGQRRQDLLVLLKSLDEQIGQLDQAAEETAQRDKMAQLLKTQPWGGADHGTGVCGGHRRCHAVSAEHAGVQLCRADSALAQLGRTAAAGRDQQAGQPVLAAVAGGSGAERGALRREFAEAVSTALSSQTERRGQGSGSTPVGGTTLLDVAHQYCVSRDRSHREQPAGAPGRRKLDRGIDWALSPPAGDGRFAWKDHGRGSGRIDGWWNEVGFTG